MRLFHRLIVILIVTTIITLFLFIQSATALPDLAVDSLSVANEIVKSQNAEAEMQKYVKDKYSDWLWETAGGYEKLLNGDLLGQSYIEEITDKFDRLQTVVNGISDFVLAMDAGEYDEALYHTLNTSVGALDHPLVTATWEAAKLTYQSHVLVQETEAAIQIEQLFNTLHKDRRLFASQKGKMKQIPVSKDTVDYFFNEYIVTNFNTRKMVKAYVEQRLNETWPEESWSSWLSNLKAVGSGIDTSEAEETAALTGEYKNKARSWIKRLMEDVNLEAQRWYSQKELRKLRAEFESFRKKFNAFDADLGEILQDFLRMKEIKGNEEFYNQFLEQRQKHYQVVKNKLNEKSPKKPSLYNSLYGQAEKYLFKLMSYGSQVRWVGMKNLANQYSQQYRQWSRLKEEIYSKLPPVENDVEAAYVRTYATSNNTQINPSDLNNWAVIKALLTDLMGQEVFDVDRFYQLKSQYKNALNTMNDESYEGEDYYNFKQPLLNITEVGKVRYEWNRYRDQCESELRKLEGLIKKRSRLYIAQVEGEDINDASEAELAGINKIEQAVNKEINRQQEQSREGYYISLFYNDQGEKLNYPDPKKLLSFKKSYVQDAVPTAKKLFVESVATPNQVQLKEANSWFGQQDRLLQQRTDNSRKQYDEIYDYLEQIKAILIDVRPGVSYLDGYRVEEAINFSLSRTNLIEWINGLETEARENRFKNYTGLRMGSGKINISNSLKNDARRVMRGIESQESISISEEFYLNQQNEIAAAEIVWQRLQLPTAKESQEIIKLVDRDFSLKELRKIGVELTRVSNELTEVKTRLEELRLSYETDADKRIKTAKWLNDIAYRSELLLNKLKRSGYIEDDHNFILNLPEGSSYIGKNSINRGKKRWDGMILTAEPYPHLMKNSESTVLQNRTKVLKDEFNKAGLYNFYKRYAKQSFKTLDNILELKQIADYHTPIRFASEDIIVHPVYIKQKNTIQNLANARDFAVIRASDLTTAEEILRTINIEDRGEFIESIRQISELLPLTAEIRKFGSPKDEVEEPRLLIKAETLEYLTEHKLALRYKDFALTLRETFYDYNHRADREARKESEKLVKYDQLATQIEVVINSVRGFLVDKDYKNALLYEDSLEDFKNQYFNILGVNEDTKIEKLLDELEGVINKVKRVKKRGEENRKEVRKFYTEFARRYQAQDEYGVLSLLADEWEAADGTTIWELEETLMRNFRVFDEITYKISNFEIIEERNNNLYLVHYDLKIVSYIYSQNIEHQELSSVREIVEIKRDGLGRVIKTVGGRFWKE